MRYDLVTLSDGWGPRAVKLVHGSYESIFEAFEARRIASDVVVRHGTADVVKSLYWLWPWERAAGAASYAYRLACPDDSKSAEWEAKAVVLDAQADAAGGAL